MGKFLFIVPPLTGHINPTLSVGAELLKRGHSAAWACHEALQSGFETLLGEKLPEGADFLPIPDRMEAREYEQMVTKAKSIKGLRSLKFLYEDVFIPMAKSTKPGIDKVVDTYQPDVIINDQQAFAGAVTAFQKNIPYASFCTTSAGVLDPLDGFNKITQWEIDQILNLQKGFGIDINEKLNTSTQLTIVFSTKKFVGETYDFPGYYKFVGPSISKRRDNTEFPWDRFHNKNQTKILVSLGTVNQEIGQPFFKKILQAFEGKELLVIVVAPEDFFEYIPENFIVQQRIPQLDVLPHIQAVVSHAGHNTVCESLANGLPLVVAPIKDDQSRVASQVVAAGVGIRLRFLRFKPEEMINAVMSLINNPLYKENALKIKNSFLEAGGAPKAAEYLEALLVKALGR